MFWHFAATHFKSKSEKELRYPYEKFDWKKSFLRLLPKARIEDEKINLFIPDANVYLEIKNAVEANGEYVDMTLNPKVLRVSPEEFLDLIVDLTDSEHVEIVKKSIQDTLSETQAAVNFLTTESFAKQIKNAGLNFGIKALASLLGKVPVAGSYLEEALPEFTESIENSVSAKIYKKGLENKKSSV